MGRLSHLALEPTLSLFQLSAIFLAIVTAVGWINTRFLRLPPAVAMLSAGVAGALLLFAAQTVIPPFWGFNSVRDVIGRLDFTEAVLGYMLAFLLFAAGMQLNLHELRRRRVAVWTLATVGVLLSTLLIGFGVWEAARLLGVPLPLAWAMVFGALISPTDPVAVLSAARAGGLSPRLATVLQGEALFNDGVGLVAFSAALAFARSGALPQPMHALGEVLMQAGGGLALGLVGGHAVVRLLRTVDDYAFEVTATLALAVGVYALAERLHVSGPIAAAAAGLVVGSYGMKIALSAESRRYVSGFWELIDEILNAVLFLLLGLQVFVVPFAVREIGLWVTAVGLAGAARLLVVLPWGAYFHFRHEERGASLVLAWGGLRGAISLALALSVPHGPARDVILSMAFSVVIFSVLVQGLTFKPLAARLRGAPEDARKSPA